jgi:thiamine-monophosphate kinase
VLSGGDDYELVFTAPREHRAELEALSRELELPLARIGEIHAGEARLAVLDAQGKPLAHRGGYDHFAA